MIEFFAREYSWSIFIFMKMTPAQAMLYVNKKRRTRGKQVASMAEARKELERMRQKGT